MPSPHLLYTLGALFPAALVATAVATSASALPSLLLHMPGADPSVLYHAGHYYLVQSENARSGAAIYLYRAATLAGLASAEKVCIHRAPRTGPRSRNLWAPEIHHLEGRFYVYFAADDGRNENHRMYVISSDTPTGAYSTPRQITDATNRWAIDGTVLRLAGKLYFVWSGWEGTRNVQQNLYIAAMSDPQTITGPRVKLSSPDQPWERVSGPHPCYVNEGPAVLQKNGQTFIAYSANGFWSNDYCLGLLTLTGHDPLNPAHWRKHNGPVFSRTDFAFNVGHNCFVTTPDGDDVMLYHAIDRPDTGGEGRSIRAQAIACQADGTPSFGRPAAVEEKLAVRLVR